MADVVGSSGSALGAVSNALDTLLHASTPPRREPYPASPIAHPFSPLKPHLLFNSLVPMITLMPQSQRTIVNLDIILNIRLIGIVHIVAVYRNWVVANCIVAIFAKSRFYVNISCHVVDMLNHCRSLSHPKNTKCGSIVEFWLDVVYECYSK